MSKADSWHTSSLTDNGNSGWQPVEETVEGGNDEGGNDTDDNDMEIDDTIQTGDVQMTKARRGKSKSNIGKGKKKGKGGHVRRKTYTEDENNDKNGGRYQKDKYIRNEKKRSQTFHNKSGSIINHVCIFYFFSCFFC